MRVRFNQLILGECINDSECSLDRACYDYNCRSPCDRACGQNAECQARNHGAICSCPSGFVGDPLTACRQSRRQQANVVGFSRFRRNLDPYFLLFPENWFKNLNQKREAEKEALHTYIRYVQCTENNVNFLILYSVTFLTNIQYKQKVYNVCI